MLYQSQASFSAMNPVAVMIQQRSSLQFTKSYQSWISTAELNSNGENDKKPAKEKDTRTIPCRYFTEHI
ncbi:hypothetical protein F511_46882 [Dorcoceras hygrometricum]|uniref:Uncharacterized protein n=1 Tax=Dorcoceras hygrometricum TaxID=472368 RepID=A0A2Z6ZZ61_9LAMI|nr:hypothetical protein F511_46882 [Dorcoceras hygrometricum]